MVSTCPMRMRETSARAFARAMAATVVPVRVAMWLTVSPERTVYCSSAWAAPAGRGHADDGQREALAPVAARRSPAGGGVAATWRHLVVRK